MLLVEPPQGFPVCLVVCLPFDGIGVRYPGDTTSSGPCLEWYRAVVTTSGVDTVTMGQQL
jgi:hypothetical protein